MKPITIPILSVLLLFSGPAVAKINVVSTLSDFAAIAAEIGGERVETEAIASGRMDPHYVEILPSYMLMVRKARVFLVGGMDLEPWARGVLDGARNSNLRIVDCSANIEILEKPTGRVDMSMGDIHSAGNPHYWLDPANGIPIARTIHAALVAVDPEGSAYYDERLAAFEAALTGRIVAWKARMEPFAETELVYFHNSWPYFNAAFGLDAAGFVEPKPGVDPSPGHKARIIELIQERGIRVVAMSPFYSSKVPDSIAKQTGARVVVLASSVGGVDGAEDYFGLFEVNTQRLAQALEAAP